VDTTFLFGHKGRTSGASDEVEHTYLKHLQFMRRRRPVLSFLLFLLFLPVNILKIRRLIRSNGIHIIHIDGITNVVPALAARLTRTPVIYHYNDHLPRLLERFFVPMAGALSARIIVQGQKLRQSRTAGHPGLESKTTVIYGGLDTRQFDPARYDARSRERLRAELGIPPTSRLIGAIGNLNPMKGHAYFIEAAREVKDAVPEARFIIVGRPLETAPTCWERLQRLTHELGLQNDVTFAGFREDIPAILSVLDVFVLSSVLESCPCVLLEAMAMKVPVVTTDVGAAAELVIDQQTGRVVPARNAGALAQAVLAYLTDSPSQTQTMIDAARKRVETEFEIGRIADQQRRVYEDLAGSQPI
jgi:glycosyltransferase involved in cell wall biosynthesis